MKRGTLLITILLVSICCSVGTCRAQSIIPKPNSCAVNEGTMGLTPGMTIGYTDARLKGAAEYLAGIMRPSTGYQVKTQGKRGNITLSLGNGETTKGAYSLTVNEKGVNIIGTDYRGVIAGIQTLRQLLPAEIESRTKVSGVEWALPFCEIKDTPRYGWRGFELDCSRHFYTKSEVMKVLDFMSLYKLNKFHWHLTDDQGWRLEIKRYPKLTENGAWRKFNNQDTMCIKTARTTGNPDMFLPREKEKIVGGDTLYGGYYTQKDVREIIEYARVRGIDIIPEIDMPGHILAAETNYKGISCFENIGWGTYFTSPLCPGKDTALEFCRNVYAEVMALFPYEYVHIGGDEVDKRNWKKCPDCQKRMKDNGLKTEEQLQSWFIHEMEKFINSKGKKMIGWNEIIEGGLSDTSTIMWWGSWVKDAPQVTTAHGNDLICTPNDKFYLDYVEGADAMKNIYNFDMTLGLDENQQKHILGVQGNLWCEQVPSMNRAWYQAANRLLAVSELGWSAAEPRNYYEFEDRMISQLPRFRALGVRSKILPIEGFGTVNAFVGEGRYNVTCKDPSVVIRYTNDGTLPNENSKKLENSLFTTTTTQNVKFAGFRLDGSRGDVVSAKFVKQEYAPAVSANPTQNGLVTEWHEFPGIDCNKIADAPLNKTYKTADICIPEGVKGNIGLLTTGYIYIPETGIYTFTLTSDDGSDLFVDGQEIVDMNKEQSPETTVGQMALAKGYHTIRVRYFDHNGGCLGMVVTNEKGTVMQPGELYYSK